MLNLSNIQNVTTCKKQGTVTRTRIQDVHIVEGNSSEKII